MVKKEHLMKCAIFHRMFRIYDHFPSGLGEIPAGVEEIASANGTKKTIKASKAGMSVKVQP